MGKIIGATGFKKLPKNMGKIIVATGFKKLPKIWAK